MDNLDSIDIHVGSLKVEGDATKLFEELAKAQADFDPVPRDSAGQVGTNRFFKYADYATLTRCTRPYLTKRGIVVLQPLHFENGMAVTTTIIAGHGARISSSFSFKADPNPQEFGRHHTYYRRYQLQGMLGLEGEDSDDPGAMREKNGFTEKAPAAPKAPAAEAPKAAQKPPVAEKPKAEPPKAAAPKADSRTQNQRLVDAAKQLNWKTDDLKAFYREHVDPAGYNRGDDLSVEQKDALLKALAEKKGVGPF